MLKLRKCTICKIEKPANLEYFYKSSKTKRDGLSAKCKVCRNKEAKIYMRKTRIARRFKKCNLYNGRVSKLALDKLSKSDLVDMAFELSRQLLYSASRSRFCVICERYHDNNHKK